MSSPAEPLPLGAMGSVSATNGSGAFFSERQLESVGGRPRPSVVRSCLISSGSSTASRLNSQSSLSVPFWTLSILRPKIWMTFRCSLKTGTTMHPRNTSCPDDFSSPMALSRLSQIVPGFDLMRRQQLLQCSVDETDLELFDRSAVCDSA